MDHMIVHVEKRDQSADTSSGIQLAELIKANIGITAEVQLGDVGSVARSQGKAVRIVDHRKLDS